MNLHPLFADILKPYTPADKPCSCAAGYAMDGREPCNKCQLPNPEPVTVHDFRDYQSDWRGRKNDMTTFGTLLQPGR